MSDCHRKRGDFAAAKEVLDQARANPGAVTGEALGRIESPGRVPAPVAQEPTDAALKTAFGAYRTLKRTASHAEVAYIQLLIANCYLQRCSPTSRSAGPARERSSPAASSRCWRSGGSSAPARASSSSTSRPRASRRSSSSRSAPRFASSRPRVHDPHGRAEPPLRVHHRRSPLRRRARPGGGHLPEHRARRERGQAAHLSRGVSHALVCVSPEGLRDHANHVHGAIERGVRRARPPSPAAFSSLSRSPPSSPARSGARANRLLARRPRGPRPPRATPSRSACSPILSGLYADLAGEGSVLAARMAVEDFGGSVNGVPVEVVSGDHQNKADVGSNLARQWMTSTGCRRSWMCRPPPSPSRSTTGRDKNKVLFASGAGTTRSHRKGLHAEHRPLDLRHLGARQRDRQGRSSRRAAIAGSS